MGNEKLNDLRREYEKGSLDEQNINRNPFIQFGNWIDEAITFIKIDPTAMILSTVSKDFIPSSRIVLLKEFSEKGFCFFTNYESRKANEIEATSNASILFFWKELDRQIRIEGTIERTEAKVSDGYFDSRPFDSRISAIVSAQSKDVDNREILDKAFADKKEKLAGGNPNRPDYWGGYILKASYFEFWQGRENRLHDRLVYEFEGEHWNIKRIAP